MCERDELLELIAERVQDYRAGELGPPTSSHVDRWINQFPEEKQLPILKEMHQVLGETYISFEIMTKFLETVLRAKKLVGDNVCQFWQTVNFLDIQGGGNSQREMLTLFNEILRKECQIGIDDCGGSNVFIYLDDGLFSGNRIRRDLEEWVRNTAPDHAEIHIVTIAIHRGGHYYARTQIEETASAVGKEISLTWWRGIELEDRRAYTNTSDVLRPVLIPEDPAVQGYINDLDYPPTLRRPGSTGNNAIFSSESGRNVLEQEFLIAGVHIRQQSPNLGDTQRPLGHSTLQTPGFGSLIVTFRNCPNNAPLALWVGDPWYPLFPRTTNSQTEIRRMFEDLVVD